MDIQYLRDKLSGEPKMLPYETHDFKYVQNIKAARQYRFKTGTYILVHQKTGFYYIGSTADVRGRLGVHFGRLEKETHVNSRLQDAYNMCPIFDIYVLECKSREKALEIELSLIDMFQNKVFNIQQNSSAHAFRKASDETRQKLSESHRGYVHTKEQRRKISESLKNHPDRERLIANKTSGNHVRAQGVIVQGKYYASIREAQRETNIPWSTLMFRIKSASSEFRDYQRLN